MKPIVIFCLVSVITKADFLRFMHTLANIADVKEIHPVMGMYDFVVKIESSRAIDVENALKRIKSITGVAKVNTLCVKTPVAPRE
ncbi:MAG: Lrp/AsnC ligand binding domain-containing protein [Candidatus Thorarchaeota archaeon]